MKGEAVWVRRLKRFIGGTLYMIAVDWLFSLYTHDNTHDCCYFAPFIL